MKAILLSSMLLAASAGSVFAQGERLNGIQWTLIYANGQEVTSSLAYFQIEDDGSFTGNTGCNRMFGKVDVKPQRITFGNIGSTKRMCKLMPGSVPENVFLNALGQSARYTRNGNSLTIMDRRGRTILKFKRLVRRPPVEDPAPDEISLENRKWMLESIRNRRTFAPITGVFINFDSAKRSAGGDSGCNVFGGKYTVNGKKIRITDLVSTMRACVEDGRMTVEREFLEGLRTANRHELKDGRLLLYRGQNLLLTLRGTAKS